MPRAALADRDVEAFRAELCRAAERRFADLGYAGVTLRGLAADLGCSPMTPYRYFENKEAIFAAVRRAAFERFAARQERAVAAHDDPVERLQAGGEAYLAFATEEPHAYRIMFELDQEFDPGDAGLVDASGRAWAPLREGVARAIDAGVLGGDPDTVAHLLWAGLHGLVSLHLAGKLQLGRRLEELIPPMMQALFLGNRPQLDSAVEDPS